MNHCPTCGGSYGRAKNGSGSHLADDFVKPSPSHWNIINMMLEADNTKEYTKTQLYSMTNNWLLSKGQERAIIDPFMARVSELLRRGVFTMRKGNVMRKTSEDLPPITVVKPVYKFNVDYAKKIVETGVY